MNRHRHMAIFITGGAVLSLEVISSRVMTPYFGVSLIIWASILSVTLIFMAGGYRWGGWLAGRYSLERIDTLFRLLPALAGAAIAVSCLVYPVWFPRLAEWHLLGGSFAACLVLIAVPLVLLAALNPLLVAVTKAPEEARDAGAGEVLFISTIGSVAGVLVTAFIFASRFTNFQSLLLIALALAATSLLLALAPQGVVPGGRRLILLTAGFTLLGSAVLFVGYRHYLEWSVSDTLGRHHFRIVDERNSIFGNIKVAEFGEGESRWRYYLQDGISQDGVDGSGRATTLFTYMLEKLTNTHVPQARRVLVLGMAAGIVPMRLARQGIEVTVVDINPDAPEVASRHFGFDPALASVVIEDARTLVRRCQQPFDAVVIDLFQGDSSPDHLMTREFFQSAARCLVPMGSLVINVFFDPREEGANRLLLATLLSALPRLTVYRVPASLDGGAIQSAFLVADRGVGKGPPPVPVVVAGEVPSFLEASYRQTLAGGVVVRETELAGVDPATDELNHFSSVFAASRMRFRRSMVRHLPPLMLVN